MNKFLKEIDVINSYNYSAISLIVDSLFIGMIFCNNIKFDTDLNCICFYSYDDIVFSLSYDFTNKYNFSYKILNVNSVNQIQILVEKK